MGTRTYVWDCAPECGRSVTLYVRAFEVWCPDHVRGARMKPTSKGAKLKESKTK